QPARRRQAVELWRGIQSCPGQAAVAARELRFPGPPRAGRFFPASDSPAARVAAFLSAELDHSQDPGSGAAARICGFQQGELPMPDNIEMAQAACLHRISSVAREKLGIPDEHLQPYGHYKVKGSLDYLESLKGRKDGKLVLVTANSPTPAG